MAPRGYDPLAVEVDVETSTQARASRVNRLATLVGVTVSAACIIAIAFGLTRTDQRVGPDQQATTTAASSPAEATPSKAPSAVVAETAPPKEASSTHASGSASASTNTKDHADSSDTKDGAGTKGKKGKARAARNGTKAKKSPSPASTPTPTPAPKRADPCGCKGDLNCAIACVATHGP